MRGINIRLIRRNPHNVGEVLGAQASNMTRARSRIELEQARGNTSRTERHDGRPTPRFYSHGVTCELPGTGGEIRDTPCRAHARGVQHHRSWQAADDRCHRGPGRSFRETARAALFTLDRANDRRSLSPGWVIAGMVCDPRGRTGECSTHPGRVVSRRLLAHNSTPIPGAIIGPYASGLGALARWTHCRRYCRGLRAGNAGCGRGAKRGHESHAFVYSLFAVNGTCGCTRANARAVNVRRARHVGLHQATDTAFGLAADGASDTR